eukprot:CAMPEP_0170614570 /NCGR_PEP_ID=MMETSP0224-20130122/24875_2 /TAXON_ID=285029 /ORGANISM="Togula jolla, Strain CCCM 725" /LENGTH=216 /DNA_ID=CAMNT_0010940245 /DNA_START=56 /DNA_END=703 /DNA_ORIENTATION=-
MNARSDAGGSARSARVYKATFGKEITLGCSPQGSGARTPLGGLPRHGLGLAGAPRSWEPRLPREIPDDYGEPSRPHPSDTSPENSACPKLRLLFGAQQGPLGVAGRPGGMDPLFGAVAHPLVRWSGIPAKEGDVNGVPKVSPHVTSHQSHFPDIPRDCAAAQRGLNIVAQAARVATDRLEPVRPRLEGFLSAVDAHFPGSIDQLRTSPRGVQRKAK